MNVHSKAYRFAKIFIITVSCLALILSGIGTYGTIAAGEYLNLLPLAFVLVFLITVSYILLTFFGRQINEISFSDGNIIFLLNNKKTVCFDCFRVKSVVKDFTRITFVCADETGKNHSYMIDTYYLFFGKAPVDIDNLKIHLPMAEFFGV